MDTGRKIYFKKATGEILYDTGEKQGDVVATSFNDDYAAIPQLKQLAKTEIDFIALEFGERRDEFQNIGKMTVDTAKKTLMIYQKPSMAADKTTIQADGVDTATITATITDGTYTGAINFTIDGTTLYPVNCVKGVATFELASSVPGEYRVWAKNDLYGTNSIKVVVA
jgi:hypothetical protein